MEVVEDQRTGRLEKVKNNKLVRKPVLNRMDFLLELLKQADEVVAIQPLAVSYEANPTLKKLVLCP